MPGLGKVYILGAGPGDDRLITLKAAECIGKADAIVYDRLVGSSVLGLAKNNAELINVGKMPDFHAIPQDEINEILVKKAEEGKIVARVKGGDPFVFGRGGEEAEFLHENGIEFEIIPGVTSAVAVPAYGGIPVTHRDHCSSLHIITGHERPGKESSFINYEALSKLEGTIVFLMGVKNLQIICKNLIECGKESSTPAAVIEKGTTIDQRVVVGTLADIENKVHDAKIQSPAVTVIGSVVGLRERLNWFPKGKLAGKRIIVTRAREQASSLVSSIRDLGGETVEFPTIRIEEPSDFSQFDKVLENIRDYNWIVFTSVNGVKGFFGRMRVKNIDIRSLYGIKLCAVGEATGRELNMLGLTVDYIPQSYTTHELLKGLINLAEPDEKILLARADIANDELSEGLKNSRIKTEELVVYRTVMESSQKESILELLNDNKVDYITFTSSSTVRNFVQLVGNEGMDGLTNVKVVCIGPVTEKTAKDMGLHVTAIADVFTIEGLVNKLVELTEEI